MKKGFISSILCVSMVAGLLAGCGGNSGNTDNTGGSDNAGSNTSSSTESGNETTAAGGATVEYASDDERGIVAGTEVNIGQTSDKPNHLPWLNTAGGFLYMQIYDTLFYPVEGDWSNIDGLLADSWEMDEDNLGITIKLVENATFTNGDVLDAQAVIDSLAYTKQYMESYFKKIDSIEKTGDYELHMKFNAYYPDFMVQFSQCYTGIVDPKAVEEHGPEDNAAAIGSGPFYIENYSPTDKLTLHANENYWNPSRMPSVERVNLVYIPDSNTEQIALQNGEIDFMEVMDVDTLTLVTASDNVEYQAYQGTQIPFWYNENSSILADERVREAVSKLVDMDEVAYMQSGDYGVACKNPWMNNNIANVEGRDITPDPDAALALLDEAGVDPKSLTFTAIGCPHAKAALTAIQAQLANYGITMNFDIYDYGTFGSQIAAGQWDICTVSGDMNSYAPFDGYKIFTGSNATKKVVDFSKADPDVEKQIDEYLAEADECATIEDQAKVLQNLTQLLNDEYAWPWSMTMCKFNIYSSRLSNVHFDGNQGFFMLWDIIVKE